MEYELKENYFLFNEFWILEFKEKYFNLKKLKKCFIYLFIYQPKGVKFEFIILFKTDISLES